MPKNLVVFGCSFVYGHGLPDCHIDPDQPGPHPSNMAWPSLLAQRLGRNCINISSPGASNFEIVLNVLKFKFHPDDICIIMWTFPDRDWILYDNGKTEKIGNWADKNKFISWLKLNPEKTTHLRFWSWVTLIHSWLISNGIKVYYLQPRMNLYGICPPWAKHVKFLSSNLFEIRQIYPKALDNRHPGPEAHQVFAKEVFNEIEQPTGETYALRSYDP
jgi:hypothetical protein